MYDRLINHIIRQACKDRLGANQQPAFMLYLGIDPHQVDVSVRPAKHEVHFHQSRLMYDFIYQSILSVLQQRLDTSLAEKSDPPTPHQVPGNHITADGNQSAWPSGACEAAARFSATSSREPTASGSSFGNTSWPYA